MFEAENTDILHLASVSTQFICHYTKHLLMSKAQVYM